MKYFKLCLSDSRGTLLYAKDVETRTLFGSFIRAKVSQLVQRHVIYRKEHYSAAIIPQYETEFKLIPEIIGSPPTPAKQATWLDIRLHEPIKNEPVNFLTIELHLRERNFLYREDIEFLQVGRRYLESKVLPILVSLGIVKHQDEVTPYLLACDDDEAEFEREHIPHLEQQAKSLIEFVDTQESISFPYHDPALYSETKVISSPSPDDIRIYVNQKVMEPLIQEGKLSTEVERGGILVGSVYESLDGGRKIIEVSDMISSEHNASSVTELRYTFESWLVQSLRMKKEFSGKKIVGWYHTHLIDLAVHTKNGNLEQTKLFFSRDDVFLHKQFFPDEWYVALVLDPQGNSLFFQWKDNEIVACQGYYIFEDVGIAN